MDAFDAGIVVSAVHRLVASGILPSRHTMASPSSEEKDSRRRMTYFPDLDGWRFVAFLAVFYHHSFATTFDHISQSSTYQILKSTTRNGELGVDFFFVLSGFLIIYLLIIERYSTNKINIKNFYIRRILRIFPLYYFCLFFGFAIFPIAKQLLGQTPEETAHLGRYLVFLGNFDTIANGVVPDSSVLGILWSIAIEEQFYLTIPFILVLLPTRLYGWLFAAVIALSLIFRTAYIEDYFVIKFHTIAYVGNLAIGGLIAYYSATNERFLAFFSKLDRKFILAGYAVLAMLFIFRNDIFVNDILRVFEAVAFSVMFAFVILEQNFSKGSFFKMRNNRVFSKLGTYTYGLYCLHLIAFLIVLQITGRMGLNKNIWEVVFLETPLALIASIGIAYASYRFFERPFMLLKNRFASISARARGETV